MPGKSSQHRSAITIVEYTLPILLSFSVQLRETEAMDSKALTCLPKGSVVSILKSKVSENYDILSRRVLVRHVRKDPQTQSDSVTEGWASVQSSQGYVILSPLVSTCYSNTRWGSTRPIIKQCGHAAHLKCVETHTLSLHQRAAGDVNYDGRYAANIKEGEFLCPLCKQLSNILIPRDGRSNSHSPGVMDVEHSGDTHPGRAPDVAESFRRKLVTPRSSINDLNPMDRRALEDFGANLHTAMRVSWERTIGIRKKQQDKWHSAIHKWDYEDSEGGVKHLLRLFRQQLIAWAAVGHSAAALETGARGVETVMPFGVFPETTDPWSDYNEESMDTHPMLLELKRILSGSSGLLEILFIEVSKQLASRTRLLNEAPLVASCIADILEGKSWLRYLATSDNQDSKVPLWSEVTALVAAMPSHVAKDGTIPLRCEARATAAAMWAVKGLACDANTKTEPPAPLAIMKLFSEGKKHPTLPANWGSLQPFVEENLTRSDPGVPSRLGVACGYLYTPLLAWDMCTFSGAVFSCAIASNTSDLPNGDELLRLAHTLLLGRMVQAIVTPGGFHIPDEMDLEDEECWTNEEVAVQGPALAKLVAHCRAMVQNETSEMPKGLVGNCSDISPPGVLAGIGRAILPYARSLVLMLRACCAVIRERHSSTGSKTITSETDKYLQSILRQEDLMTTEDGFSIAKVLGGPLPTELIDDPNANDWFSLINRWLTATIGFEKHHGSSGRSVVQAASLPDGRSTADAAPAQAAPTAYATGRANDHVFSDESGEDDTAMDVDEPNRFDRLGIIRRADNDDFLYRGDIADSDEELADSMDGMDDDAEEMVSFDIAGAEGRIRGASPGGMSNGDTGESDDNSSSAMDEGGDDDIQELDRRFANSSRSPILPYQPSVLGKAGVGLGRHGSMFEYSIANEVMSDLSHLGLGHQKGASTFTLIRLPKSFVELYNIVNKVKGREDSTAAMDDSDDIGSSETSICLLTGAVMRSGSTRRAYNRAARPPGACTLHARKTASGIGIFFLVQKCTVLLMHNNKSAYSASLYVDEHGEEDPQLRRGRPLFLNEARYRALELLWRQQRIPREVAQIRSTSERVIRDNWY